MDLALAWLLAINRLITTDPEEYVLMGTIPQATPTRMTAH